MESERWRKGERQRGTESERWRNRRREAERDRERGMEKGREAERDREREMEKEKERDREQDRWREHWVTSIINECTESVVGVGAVVVVALKSLSGPPKKPREPT